MKTKTNCCIVLKKTNKQSTTQIENVVWYEIEYRFGTCFLFFCQVLFTLNVQYFSAWNYTGLLSQHTKRKTFTVLHLSRGWKIRAILLGNVKKLNSAEDDKLTDKEQNQRTLLIKSSHLDSRLPAEDIIYFLFDKNGSYVPCFCYQEKLERERSWEREVTCTNYWTSSLYCKVYSGTIAI